MLCLCVGVCVVHVCRGVLCLCVGVCVVLVCRVCVVHV